MLAMIGGQVAGSQLEPSYCNCSVLVRVMPRSPLWIPAFAGMTVACGCAHQEIPHEV